MRTFQGTLKRYYKSFVGRDCKLLAQLAVHLLSMYMDDGEKEVWFTLSKVSAGNSYMFMHYMCQQVFRIAYFQPFDPEMVGSYESVVAPVLLLFWLTFIT